MTEEQKADYQVTWRVCNDERHAHIHLYRGDSLNLNHKGSVRGILFNVEEARPDAPTLRISKDGHRVVIESETEDEIVFRLEPK